MTYGPRCIRYSPPTGPSLTSWPWRRTKCAVKPTLYSRMFKLAHKHYVHFKGSTSSASKWYVFFNVGLCDKRPIGSLITFFFRKLSMRRAHQMFSLSFGVHILLLPPSKTLYPATCKNPSSAVPLVLSLLDRPISMANHKVWSALARRKVTKEKPPWMKTVMYRWRHLPMKINGAIPGQFHFMASGKGNEASRGWEIVLLNFVRANCLTMVWHYPGARRARVGRLNSHTGLLDRAKWEDTSLELPSVHLRFFPWHPLCCTGEQRRPERQIPDDTTRHEPLNIHQSPIFFLSLSLSLSFLIIRFFSVWRGWNGMGNLLQNWSHPLPPHSSIAFYTAPGPGIDRLHPSRWVPGHPCEG